MTTEPTGLVTDTTDMVLIHRVFRRGFARLPELVATAPAGGAPRVERVAAHGRELLAALHHHHTNEDELLWPRLRARADLGRDLVDRMEAQHADLDAELTRAGALLDAAEWAGSAEARSALVASLRAVEVLLELHLNEEEREVLPLVHRHISAAEWAELGERGMASVPREQRLVMLAEILTDASPAERRSFLARVPAPARVAYRLFGARAHRRATADLAGPFASSAA